MKVFLGLLLAVAISSTVGLPARDPNADAEYIPRVPNYNKFDGVIDTGSDDLPDTYNPFSGIGTGFGSTSDAADSGIFNSFYDVMKRFRERVFGNVWDRVPAFNIGEIDPSKGNSTSVVKVIDGHKVEINDTVYSNAGEGGDSIFKFRVINIRPLDEDGSPTETDVTENSNPSNDIIPTTEKREREPLDNEVDSYGASESTTHQSQDSDDTPTTTMQSSDELPTEASTSQSQDDSEEIDSTTVELSSLGETVSMETVNFPTGEESGEHFEKLVSMVEPPQKNLKVSFEDMTLPSQPSQEFSADSSAATTSKLRHVSPSHHTEWSEEEDDERLSGPAGSEWENIENSNWHMNREDNSLDEVHRIPVDLSNDIEVNNILADQGAPTNPDAEVFAVPRPTQSLQYRPPVFNPARPPVFDSVPPPPFGWYPYPYHQRQIWPKRK